MKKVNYTLEELSREALIAEVNFLREKVEDHRKTEYYVGVRVGELVQKVAMYEARDLTLARLARTNANA